MFLYTVVECLVSIVCMGYSISPYTFVQVFMDDVCFVSCSALLYAPLEYLVSAAKDGSIKASGSPPSYPRHSN